MNTISKDPTHQAVQDYYGKVARESAPCCGGKAKDEQIESCCSGSAGSAEPVNGLYNSELLQGIPEDIAASSQGSGDPVTLAKLKPGEIILDLGSGTGLDAILAARLVGKTGHVIGVDMTPEMLERARLNIDRLQLNNVEIREGLLEALPVADQQVDVVISNCVINLSPDKPQVLREMFRVLKPGGRIAISDTVANHAVSEEERRNTGSWCACTSGALTMKDYITELGKAGFRDIHLEPDIRVIKKAVEEGNVQSQSGRSKEQFFEDLKHLDENQALIIAPYLITAIKPK
jgi:SAM-dependent methyltransferase